MRAVDLIRQKRDGNALDPDHIRWLIDAYTRGEVGDDQMAAFAMAVYFQGMNDLELSGLVQSMLDSGDVMDLSSISGTKVDKHSTGGVGDKISICLAPLVAACGVPVPMISGRGLGHTGGTLDKLGAIPGFTTDQTNQRFIELLKSTNMALIGQTSTLAPADKKLYALRDVTATVESIPMISASIMSKKLAEGIDGLVLDVKVGSGAFMKTEAKARKLAETMIGIGHRMGRQVVAVLTNMSQVLGEAVGNANETWEAVEILLGKGPKDVKELTLVLGAEMLVLGKAAQTIEEGREKMQGAIDDGSGFKKLQEITEAQGGDPSSLEKRELLPTAQNRTEVAFAQEGYISEIQVDNVGRAGMILGAGRARSQDIIDPGVGLQIKVRHGDKVTPGQLLAQIDYNDDRNLEQAKTMLQEAFVLSAEKPQSTPLIIDRITQE